MTPSIRPPHLRSNKRMPAGFTLVELMITIAVLSVVVAIALPAYNGYLREGHFTAMRTTLHGMRTAIEDFRLDNGNYGTVATLSGIAAISGRFDWEPSGDTGGYNYAVDVVSATSYNVWGQFGSGVWVRCDNRFLNCCDSDTGTAITSACP